MPRLTTPEAIEATKIWSAAGLSPGGLIRERPFRAPHHTASITALVGGGPDPRPGEISLAHRGILFLDELPEFERKVLEALREPLESGRIHISRAARQAEFPAQFQLVAAMNPCPCGFLGAASGKCRCTPDQVARYRNKLSGPLLDRINSPADLRQLPEEMLPELAEELRNFLVSSVSLTGATSNRQHSSSGRST